MLIIGLGGSRFVCSKVRVVLEIPGSVSIRGKEFPKHCDYLDEKRKTKMTRTTNAKSRYLLYTLSLSLSGV